MSKVYLIIALATATLLGTVSSQDTTSPAANGTTIASTTDLSSKRHIQQLIEPLIDVCDGQCKSYGVGVIGKDTKSETCSALGDFENCLSNRCDDDRQHWEGKVDQAQTICDGCSVLHLSGLLVLLSAMLSLLI
ncbi:unnamed protein product [Lymnaea stagnalis]|uniref:Uncharacterized protein n=1 Tax=Lymnaea stagnalis TaxID=6523 RepID=A0AAV2IL72_LYMST